jgi:hypothetical protein
MMPLVKFLDCTSTRATPVDSLIATREKTHGPFTEHARITQAIKDVYHSSPGWAKLTASMREAMEMNAHKDGRILAGDPAVKDHWMDKAGYSTLVADQL